LLNVGFKRDIVQYLQYGAIKSYDTEEGKSPFGNLGINNNDDAVKKINLLFEHLQNEFGSTYENKFAHFNSDLNVFVYIWKRKNDWVVFAPYALHNDNSFLYPYDLYIFPTKESMKEKFVIY